MNILIKEQQKSDKNANIYYIYKEKYEYKLIKIKNIVKLDVIVIGGVIEVS